MVSSSSPRTCCAECEVSPATLLCEDEDLLYCRSCSTFLHCKKAWARHILTPLRLCDHCETRVAFISCASCGGRGGPLFFCPECSSELHSKKARAHHELLRTPPKPPSHDVEQAYQDHGNRSTLSEIHAKNSRRDSRLLNDATSRKHPLQRHDKDGDQTPSEERNPKPESLSDRRLHNAISTKHPLQRHGKDGDYNSSKERNPDPKSTSSCSTHKKRSTHNSPPQSRKGPKSCYQKGKENQGLAAGGNSRNSPAPEHLSTYTDTSSSSSEEDTSEDDETYGTKKYRKGFVTFEAFVVDGHDHEEDHANAVLHHEVSEDRPEGGVQAKIRKMLELGLHPYTPDIEAQQALKNAQRLLTKHNLQKADVLKSGLQGNMHAFKGGMRMVELRSKGNKAGRFESWVYSLASTVAKYFDTQYYVQKHEVLKVVFYGIKQNAECAGYAFAAAFNRISKLSADYVPSNDEKAIKKCKLKAGPSQNVYSRVSRMSYRSGLVKGLFEMVEFMKPHHQPKSSRVRANQEREKEEKSSREATQEIVLSSCESDPDDSQSGSFSGNGDLQEDDKEEIWDEFGTRMSGEGAAAHALVLHSKKIAEDFLNENKIKVTTTKHLTSKIWDGEAFLKGKRDSKNIDLGQKGITAKARKTTCHST